MSLWTQLVLVPKPWREGWSGTRSSANVPINLIKLFEGPQKYKANQVLFSPGQESDVQVLIDSSVGKVLFPAHHKILTLLNE